MALRARPSFLLLLLLLVARVVAQQNDVPLQRDFYIDVERNAAKKEARVHSGLKPLIESRADLTNVMGHRVDPRRYYYKTALLIFRDRFLQVRQGDVLLSVDPLIGFEYGRDLGDATAYADTNQFTMNTRGFLVRGDLGPKVSFQTMFHENQGRVPQYLFNRVKETGVLPGQGRVKLKDGNQLDYGWSQANVSYAPTTWLNLQVGHGKHFVGHGYRSVLLSDNASNAPFLKFSLLSRNKRWQYSWWYTKLMPGVTSADRLNAGSSSETLFGWKRAVFHHLSVNLGRVQLGLFEATMFRSVDANGVLPFDPLSVNPVIGVNTAATGFDGDNNSLAGLDVRVKVTDKAYVYGQFATDGPGRYAWQAGARAFDVLRKDLHVQVEYNSATPFMYMGAHAAQAYAHAGQAMANPLGAAYSEVVGIVDVGHKRWWLQGKLNLAAIQRDPADTTNLGSDLGKPDRLAPTEGDAMVRALTYVDASLSYVLNPNTNARIMGGFRRRDLPDQPDGAQSSYWYITLRTNLFNRYYDL